MQCSNARLRMLRQHTIRTLCASRTSSLAAGWRRGRETNTSEKYSVYADKHRLLKTRRGWNLQACKKIRLFLASTVDQAVGPVVFLGTPELQVVAFRELLENLRAWNLRLMAAHRLPDGLPVGAGVQARGDGPVAPRLRAAFLTIDLHDQFPENGHVVFQPGACRGTIIKFRYTMRLQFADVGIAGVGSTDNGRGCKLRDSDVVGMTIKAIRSKSEDNIRAQLTD